MIPRKIHQIWLGDAPAPLKWMQTWWKMNPDFEYMLWHEDDIHDLELMSDDAFTTFADNGVYDAASDIARVGILAREGGIYVDADAECLRPLDGAPFLDGGDFLTQEIIENGETITNAFIGGVEKSEFWLQYGRHLARLRISPEPRCAHGKTGRNFCCAWRITGPEVAKLVIEEMPGKATILPAWTFFTETNKGEPVTGGEGWATHHWGSTGARSHGHFKFEDYSTATDGEQPPGNGSHPNVLSILLPTRGRPEIFKRMYESALETVSPSTSLEVIAVLDDDDETRFDYPEGPTYITVPAGQDISKLWNVALGLSTGAILQLGNDDLIFRSKHWDVGIREALYSWEDRVGLVYPNDLYVTGRGIWASNPFVTREWTNALAFMTPPVFPMCWGVDTWLWLLAKKIDRCMFLEDIIIEQMHVMAGKAEMDATYAKGAFADPSIREKSNGITYSNKSQRLRKEQAHFLRQRMTTGRWK